MSSKVNILLASSVSISKFEKFPLKNFTEIRPLNFFQFKEYFYPSKISLFSNILSGMATVCKRIQYLPNFLSNLSSTYKFCLSAEQNIRPIAVRKISLCKDLSRRNKKIPDVSPYVVSLGS